MKINRQRITYLASIIIALAALIVISASFFHTELKPGTFFTADNIANLRKIQMPQPLPSENIIEVDIFVLIRITVVISIFALLFLLIFVPSSRKMILRNTIFIIIWCIIVYLSFITETEEVIEESESTPIPVATSPVEIKLPEVLNSPLPEKFETPPNWTVYLVGFIVFLLILLIIYLVYRRFRVIQDDDEIDQIASEAEHALEEIKSGVDLHNAIIRCYYEMSNILSNERGLKRKGWMTPREFEARLIKAGIPNDPVKDLTRLFEVARYSNQLPDNFQEEQAVDCLTAIINYSKRQQ